MRRPGNWLRLFTLVLVATAGATTARGATMVTSPWAPVGGQAGAAFGTSVAPAGDVNGDGYTDALVGAPLYDNGQVDEGRAYLYLGSASGLAASPAWTWEPNQVGAHAGAIVVPAGDVNRDGYADILVGAPLWDQPGHVDAGAVFVFYGSASGPGASPNVTLVNDVNGAKFGTAACTAGDVNGDQCADVIVGAPEFANGQAHEGAVYVYHGSVGGLATTAAFSLESDEVDAALGQAVSTAGDVNGDGFADVVLGAPGSSPGGHVAAGRAIVLPGSALGVNATPLITIAGQADSSATGGGVSLAGDIDGDGYADIVVGSPGDHGAGVRRGLVTFYRGRASGVDPVPLFSGSGLGDNNRVGTAVATAGDIDGDGYADVLVGNRLAFYGSTVGFAQVYVGGQSGIENSLFITGTQDGAHFGAAVATAGDCNGDGFAEILVGAPEYGEPGLALEGSARAFVGQASLPTLAPNMPLVSFNTNSYFGAGLAIVPRVDADPYAAILIGEPTYSSPGPNVGQVLLHRGTWGAVKFSPALTFPGTTDDGLFGLVIADAGDVDRDGWSDFIASSPYYSFGGLTSRGRVRFYRGAPGGPVLDPWVAEGDQADEDFGLALAGRGDVNGDGYADVLVGANRWSNGPTGQAGKVWLYPGGPTGLGASTWSAQGAVASEYFGYSIALADLDGDGYSDVAISNAPQSGGAFVRVYFGGPTGLSPDPAYTIVPAPISNTFGNSIAGIGDFDGDAIGDLAVGAPDDFGGAGVVYVYRGSAARAKPAGPYKAFIGTAGMTGVGYAVAGGGDLNGDGLADFVAGAPNSTHPENSEGRLLVFLGRASAAPLAPDTTFDSNVDNGQLGSMIAPLADVNVDGFADIVASGGGAGNGRVYVYMGGGNGTYHKIETNESHFSGIKRFSPALLDSATQVGFFHFISSPAGRDRVFQEFELVPQNRTFRGIPNRTNFSQTYYDTGSPSATFGSGGSIGSYLFGLWPGVTYHWRARGKSRSPYFPYSHWIAPDARAMGESDFRTGGAIVDVADDPVVGDARLARVAPNPSTGSTSISFALPGRAEVRLDVYDVGGRHVRSLARGAYPAGLSVIAWDGADERGCRAAPGIYFVQFRTEKVVDRSRIVRLP